MFPILSVYPLLPGEGNRAALYAQYPKENLSPVLACSSIHALEYLAQKAGLGP